MDALYLHIPFCASRCSYCDFYSQCNTELENAFVKALIEELKQRKEESKGEQVDSIYFGGGSPSQLSLDALEQILQTIYTHYRIAKGVELTFEANPDDLSKEYLQGLKQLPINRISMGVQSFVQSELQLLGRRHSSQQVLRAVEGIRNIGIRNLSLDLIYGIPNQSQSTWQESLEQCLALEPEHISAYHLIYEEGTALSHLRNSGRICEIDEELSLRFFEMLIDRLRLAGYEQYEISNFACKGLRSRHNSKYWLGLPYMGFGPSAHSFDGIRTRSYNPPSIEAYIRGIASKEEFRIYESLSPLDQYNELIMTSLRRCEGLDLDLLEQRFGAEALSYCLRQAKSFLQDGQLCLSGKQLSLSQTGIFLSDGIMSSLFRLDDKEI